MLGLHFGIQNQIIITHLIIAQSLALTSTLNFGVYEQFSFERHKQDLNKNYPTKYQNDKAKAIKHH